MQAQPSLARQDTQGVLGGAGSPLGRAGGESGIGRAESETRAKGEQTLNPKPTLKPSPRLGDTSLEREVARRAGGCDHLPGEGGRSKSGRVR